MTRPRAGGDLFERMTSFAALMAAARRAARGKRTVQGVQTFMERLEPEALRLERELRDASYRPGRAHTFEIRDPKPRVITAVPFRDRVVHHALIGALEPIFERRMLGCSFACRKGKGSHAALRRARALLREHEWFLKLDIARCFPSMRHDVVLETLGLRIGDPRVLALLRVILAGHDGLATTGLPIGSLTSQWFANLVLDRIDHFVLRALRVPGYVRYMDDFVLFAGGKAALRAAQRRVQEFVKGRLGLDLKERATILAPAARGLPFLGFVLRRGATRVRHQNLKRLRRRLWRRRRQMEEGVIDEAAFAASVQSIFAHLAYGPGDAGRATLNLRRSLAWRLDAMD